MSETGQKKRRFVVHLIDQPKAVGVVCDDYDWGIWGMLFQGSKVAGTWTRYIVFGAMHTRIDAFHELTDDQEWPDYIGRIYTEGTTIDVGIEQDSDTEQGLVRLVDIGAIADEVIGNEEGE